MDHVIISSPLTWWFFETTATTVRSEFPAQLPAWACVAVESRGGADWSKRNWTVMRSPRGPEEPWPNVLVVVYTGNTDTHSSFYQISQTGVCCLALWCHCYSLESSETCVAMKFEFSSTLSVDRLGISGHTNPTGSLAEVCLKILV